MKLISNTNREFLFNKNKYKSSVYENFTSSLEFDFMKFSDSIGDDFVLEELSNIEKLIEISENTFKLINFLDLNYLLFNNNIKLNSLIPSIIELYEIKSLDNNDKKIEKIFLYFRDNIEYINFNNIKNLP